MGEEVSGAESEPCSLALVQPVGSRARVRVGARVLTMEAVQRFGEILLSDINHTVDSAALEAGLRPSTVTDAISRYRMDKCRTLEDEAACELLVRVKHRHIRALREQGAMSAVTGNRAGTALGAVAARGAGPALSPAQAGRGRRGRGRVGDRERRRRRRVGPCASAVRGDRAPRGAGGVSGDEQVIHVGPNPGPQTKYVASSADITAFGGAAGGGKTLGTLFRFAWHADKYPGYFGAIFRREMPMITAGGGLWEESMQLYPVWDARPNISMREWRFPRHRSLIQFRSLQHATDVLNYQGAQFAEFCLEEATHFPEAMFWYMVSRLRSNCGMKPRACLTFNPGPRQLGAEADRLVHRQGWLRDTGARGRPALLRARPR
jgi:hypothetical protein